MRPKIAKPDAPAQTSAIALNRRLDAADAGPKGLRRMGWRPVVRCVGWSPGANLGPIGGKARQYIESVTYIHF